MRSASSYRGAKKKAARDAGVPFSKFNEHYGRSRHFAQAELERKALTLTPAAAQKALDVLGETPEEARKRLAIWARNGGRDTPVSQPATPAAIAAMNLTMEGAPLDWQPDQGLQDALDADKPVDPEKAVAAAKKLTIADIDRAMEKALSAHQTAGNEGPLPLGKMFAERARALLWVEGTEFVEDT